MDETLKALNLPVLVTHGAADKLILVAMANAEADCRLATGMARKDRAALVCEDRIRPTPLDALHQGSNLRLRMPSRIPGKLS
jgi:hypothetical protein